jgi:hypothetical protein
MRRIVDGERYGAAALGQGARRGQGRGPGEDQEPTFLEHSD